MLVTREEWNQLKEEWTKHRYYPENPFFDFLKEKGIGIVNRRTLGKRMAVIERDHPPSARGPYLHDLLADIAGEYVRLGDVL